MLRFSIMSSTMTFTLPLRAMAPSSLTLDPVFSLLYEDNEKGLTRLLDNKSPLLRAEILRNKPFMEYLMTKEPGPKVEYQNLRPALTALRSFLIVSPQGKKLLEFYRHLLQLQGHWAIATAEMLAFDMYVKITQSVYIDRADDKLMSHITKLVPTAAEKLAKHGAFDHGQFDMILVEERARLGEASRDAAEKLFNLKVSQDFWGQHGKLVAAIEHSEKKLQEIREKTLRRKREHEARRRAAYASNEALRDRQMGMAGMTPHSPQVERAVVGWVKDVKDDYFSFNDSIY